MTYLPPADPTSDDSDPDFPGTSAIGAASSAAAVAARAARRAQWAADAHLLRQDFLDHAHMRAILAAAGVRVADSNEPATCARLMQLARRAGMTKADFLAANGCTPQRWLQLNPRLPLWAAVAWTLEAHGVVPNPETSS